MKNFYQLYHSDQIRTLQKIFVFILFMFCMFIADLRVVNAQSLLDLYSPNFGSSEGQFDNDAFFVYNEDMVVYNTYSTTFGTYSYFVRKREAGTTNYGSPSNLTSTPSGDFVYALTEDNYLISLSESTNSRFDVFIERVNADNSLTLIRTIETLSVQYSFPFSVSTNATFGKRKTSNLVVEANDGFLLIADPSSHRYDIFEQNSGGTDNYGRVRGGGIGLFYPFTDITLHQGYALVGNPTAQSARIYDGTVVVKTISKPASISSHSQFGFRVFSDDTSFGVSSRADGSTSLASYTDVSFFETNATDASPATFHQTVTLGFNNDFGQMIEEYFIAGFTVATSSSTSLQVFGKDEGGLNNWGLAESTPSFASSNSIIEVFNGRGSKNFIWLQSRGRLQSGRYSYTSRIYGNLNPVPNSTPTDITLSANSIQENNGIDQVIGSFSTVDADASDTHTYTLVAGTGSTDNASFDIDGNDLIADEVFDFETKTVYSIRVQTDDGNGGIFDKEFSISITNDIGDDNNAPTDISLGETSFEENQSDPTEGLTIITTTDDPGDTHTYSLVNGNGVDNADNNDFEIVGDLLRSKAAFDFETQNSYRIRIQSEDQDGATYSEAFTITVIDIVDETPPIVSSTTPADDAFGVSLTDNLVLTFDENVSFENDEDGIELWDATNNELVQTMGVSQVTTTFSSTIVIDPSADLLPNTDYYVLISTEGTFVDGADNVFAGFQDPTDWNFSTSVLNNPPTDISLSSTAIQENAGTNAVVGSFSSTDTEGGSFVYTLVGGSGSTNNNSFNINGSELRTNNSFDFETVPNSYSIRVRSTDNGGLFHEESFTISVTNDPSDDPTAPVVTSFSPTDGAGDVAIDANLIVTFDQAIEFNASIAPTLSLGTLRNANGTVFEAFTVGDATINGSTLTFDPTSDFQEGSGYYMTIFSGRIENSAGQIYAGFTDTDTWNFTTQAPLDNTAPTADAFTPSRNETDVSVDLATFEVVFSEPIQFVPGTLSSVRLQNSSNTAEIYAFPLADMSINGSILTVDLTNVLTSDLINSNTYRFSIDGGLVEDLAGNDFSGLFGSDRVFFTTEDPAEMVPPAISNRAPLDGASNVPIDTDISITWNEDVNYITGAAMNIYEVGGNIQGAYFINSPGTTINGNTISWDLPVDLKEGTSYYITIAQGMVEDLSGNENDAQLATDFWTFSTEKKDQDITFNNIANRAFSPIPFQLTASASSGLAIEYTVTSGNATVNGDMLTLTGVGDITVRADQSGDEEYSAAVSKFQSFNVVKANQTITFNSLPTRDLGSDPFDLTATASSGLQVSYASSDLSVATVSGSTVTIQGVGNTTITASQPGNENYNAATNRTQTLTVTSTDVTAPIVTQFTPSHNEIDVDINVGTLTIRLSEDVFAGTFGAFNLRGGVGVDNLIKQWNFNTGTDITVSGDLVTLSNVPTLEKSGFYYVQFSAGNAVNPALSDASNNMVVGWITTGVWSFRADRLEQAVTFDPIAQRESDEVSFFLTPATSTSGLTSFTYSSSNPSVATMNGSQVLIQGSGITEITATQSGNTTYKPASASQTLTIIEADITAPVVVTFSPVDDAVNIPINIGSLELVLSEDVQLGTNFSPIRLRETFGGIVKEFEVGDVAINGNVITLNNIPALKSNTDYYVQNFTFDEGIQDLSGNPLADWNDQTTWNFRTDEGTLSTVFTPSDGAIDVAPDIGQLSIATTETLDESLSSGVLRLRRLGGNQIVEEFEIGTNEVTFSGNTLVLNNVPVLDEAASYWIQNFGNTIASTSGKTLPTWNTDDVWNFTTGSVDNTPPTITSFSPADDATGVDVNTSFSITFDEPVQFIGNGVIELLDENSVAVQNFGSAASTISGNTISFTPDNPLDPGTDYFVSIVDGTLEDLAGNDLVGFDDGTTWNFTTETDKQDQTITFEALEDKTFGDAAFDLIATASSNLAVSYTSSDETVATINGSTVTIVGAGTTTITASQEGDDTFNAATPVEQTLTVNKADQKITIDPISDKLTTDAAFDVVASTTSNLALDYAVSGPASITGTTITLDGTSGTVEVTVSQAGNDNYNAASESISFNVTDPAKTDQTITFEALEDKTFGDPAFDLTATASSSLAVSYTSSDETVATINGSTVTIVGAGTTTITASQEGDDSFNAATPVEQTLTVNKSDQTITIDPISDKLTTDAAFDVVASITSNLLLDYSVAGPATNSGATITLTGTSGTVTVTVTQAGNDNYNAASESISFNVTDPAKTDQTITFDPLASKTFGDPAFELTATASSNLAVSYTSSDETVATINGSTVTITGAGTTTITASQEGDDTFNAATPVAQTLTVNKADQTITIDLIADKLTTDAAFDVVASTTSNLVLDYAVSGPASITGTTITLDGDPGTVEVTVSQAGNDNYNAASESISFNVTDPAKTDQTITFDPLASKTFGDAAFDLSATASSSLAVSYTSSDEKVATINGSTVTIVGAGATTITASQEGDDTFNAATPVEQTLTVNKADQNIIVEPIADKLTTDVAFDVVASTTSNLVLDYSVSGPASITGTTITLDGDPGTVEITVSQEGNDNYNAASESISFNVTDPAKTDQTITFDPLASKTFGDAAFDLSATASSDLAVSYTSSDETVATISGSTVTIVGAGATTITASQEGDDTFNAAASVEQTLTVNKADQTISIEPIADKLTTDVAFDVVASTTSNLVLDYAVSGPASITGTAITLDGTPGMVEVTVSQAGNDNYNAVSASVSFAVAEESALSVVGQIPIQFYPNPVQDLLTIESVQDVDVTIYDLEGKRLKSATMRSGKIDMADLSSGAYILQIKTEKNILRKKIIRAN